jgi:hypothetical protein
LVFVFVLFFSKQDRSFKTHIYLSNPHPPRVWLLDSIRVRLALPRRRLAGVPNDCAASTTSVCAMKHCGRCGSRRNWWGLARTAR